MNKVLKFPLVRIVIAVLFVGVGLVIGQMILSLLRSAFSITDTGLANLLAFVLITPLTYSAYWLYVHYVERRVLAELDPLNALPEFGAGSLMGLGLFAVVILILWVMGVYQLSGFNSVWLPVLGTLVGAFVSAFVQELIFRGVLYRITEQWLGTAWALAISALLFGLIHLTSAGATIYSTVSVALEAGILLGATYALTHRLWMPIGLHMAWDFANDGIFGVGVAGQSGQPIKGLLQAHLSGPTLLTGGEFGVEASVITLAVLLLAGILILWRARQKGPLGTKLELTPENQ
jgi:hypothetical protein